MKRGEQGKSAIDRAGRDAALLSAVEIGLGSFLHGFRIPFSGHFLSLNQGFLLSRSVLRNADLAQVGFFPFTVSTIAAILKSLSPAGKKLTPMLAISAQGVLFGIPPLLVGPNLAGVIAGSLIASFWSFLQPVLVYYLIFGKTLVDVAEYFYEKTRESIAFDPNHLLLVLAILITLKAGLSVVAAMAAYFLPDSAVERYQETLLRAGREKRGKLAEREPERGVLRNARLALGDLLNPLFLISFAFTLLFFLLVEGAFSARLWLLLRPIAVGFLIFFLIRLIPFDKGVTWLAQWPAFRGFSGALSAALRRLREI